MLTCLYDRNLCLGMFGVPFFIYWLRSVGAMNRSLKALLLLYRASVEISSLLVLFVIFGV